MLTYSSKRFNIGLVATTTKRTRRRTTHDNHNQRENDNMKINKYLETLVSKFEGNSGVKSITVKDEGETLEMAFFNEYGASVAIMPSFIIVNYLNMQNGQKAIWRSRQYKNMDILIADIDEAVRK